MPASSTSVSLAQGVSSTSVADGLTLLDECRGVVYHLNQPGAVVLSALLDGGGEAAEAALCARYATTAETARRDVTQFLDALRAHSLMVVIA